MTYCRINGVSFDVDVAIAAYKRKLNILHGASAGRSKFGTMTLDPIGAYLGREITFFRKGDNYAALDALWDYLVQHSMDVTGVHLEAADGQSTIDFWCYYGDTEQSIERVSNGVNYWGEFTVSFVPMEAQVVPT